MAFLSLIPARNLRFSLLMLLACVPARGQFALLNSGTTASLRGIDAVNEQVAWASGSGGTVLLTTNGGTSWKHCAVPPGGEKLDFRGVQALDAKTALVMASGTGPLSAVYKTTDGCATWKPVFANPDKDGFFDALRRVSQRSFYLLGDPVGGHFALFFSNDDGESWQRFDEERDVPQVPKGVSAFAASNSSLTTLAAGDGVGLFVGTSASAQGPPLVSVNRLTCDYRPHVPVTCETRWIATPVPLASGGSGAGVFSVGGRVRALKASFSERKALMSRGMAVGQEIDTAAVVAVGGDYTRPAETAGTAAFSRDGGATWKAAASLPHGYRSAVAYAPLAGFWLAVGPNGMDMSRDDGENWSPLLPAAGAAPDADKNWNAISLPFVVGAKGRIGKLRE